MSTPLPATKEPKGRTTDEVQRVPSKTERSRKIVLMNVYQSSTHGEGLAKNTIDGLLAHQDPQSQCAVTEEQYEPWWTVDLKSKYKIYSVALTNRGDCCSSGLDGAEIRVGHDASDWKNYTICGTVSSVGLGETFSFKCNWMEGRFITIVIPDKNASLTLCEVQVFGQKAETSIKCTATPTHGSDARDQ
ncbi:pentraxin fusion protein-like [Mixophyes fleayi]|uniref:pentraxin fusion protein-like n=1 Tax=Mixophyes fleayi TaxID=3061075 RepID=UPI003F4DC302